MMQHICVFGEMDLHPIACDTPCCLWAAWQILESHKLRAPLLITTRVCARAHVVFACSFGGNVCQCVPVCASVCLCVSHRCVCVCVCVSWTVAPLRTIALRLTMTASHCSVLSRRPSAREQIACVCLSRLRSAFLSCVQQMWTGSAQVVIRCVSRRSITVRIVCVRSVRHVSVLQPPAPVSHSE